MIERGREFAAEFESEPSLAGASCARERNEPNGRIPKQLLKCFEFAFPAQQRGARQGEPMISANGLGRWHAGGSRGVAAAHCDRRRKDVAPTRNRLQNFL